MRAKEVTRGYFVSRDGRVFTKWRKGRHFIKGPTFPLREVSYTLMTSGYVTVSIAAKVRYLHQLVLEAFVGPCPPGMEACHGNGNPQDNRITNLRWDTPKANQNDRNTHGTSNKGARNGAALLSKDKVRRIRSLHSFGASIPVIARKFGCHVETVRDIVKGKTWKEKR